jgi:hypothetical protein
MEGVARQEVEAAGRRAGGGGDEAQSGGGGSSKMKMKSVARTVGHARRFRVPGTKPYLHQLPPVYSSVMNIPPRIFIGYPINILVYVRRCQVSFLISVPRNIVSLYSFLFSCSDHNRLILDSMSPRTKRIIICKCNIHIKTIHTRSPLKLTFKRIFCLL